MVIYNYYFNNNSNIRWINSAPCAELVMLFAVVYDRSLFILFIYKLLPLACHWSLVNSQYTSLSDILDRRMNSGVLHPLMAGKRETQVEVIFSFIL